MRSSLKSYCHIANRRVSYAKSGSAMGEPRTDIYGYNARSELVSSARTGGSPSPATEHDYAYDPIGTGHHPPCMTGTASPSGRSTRRTR